MKLKLRCLCFAIMMGVVYCACPQIVTRAQWQARAPTGTSTLSTPVQYAFIHHTTGSNCFSRAACQKSVKNIQNYHMNTKGWGDIGYSFLIGGDGSVYEGRGWGRVGAHTVNYNSRGYGFALIGDFTNTLPPQAQTNAVKNLIACGVSLGKLRPSYILRGHRDVASTACPGNRLYPEIKKWPHY